MRCLFLVLALAVTLPALGHEPQPHEPQPPKPVPGGIRTSRDGAKSLPLPREDGVWHFVVYGDRTGGPAAGIEILRQAVTDTNLLDPDLVMTVGDLVEGYNNTEKWLPQMEEFRGVMNGLKMAWYPVAGNHDVYWRGPQRPAGGHELNYEKHFGPLWYWFRHKDAAFVVLYTDEGDPRTGQKGFSRAVHTQMSEQQLRWLEATLEETRDLEHVFVFVHHPRWITSTYPGSNWESAHTRLAAAGNVKAVFAGHVHYMHYGGQRDGIEYFTLGTTGGVLNHEIPRAGWLHHLDVVTVRKERLSVATIPVGSVIDPRLVTPERHDDVARLLGLATPTVQHVEIHLDGSAHGAHAFDLANPTGRRIEGTVAVGSGAKGWIIRPDHFHFALEAKETITVELQCRRPAGEIPAELPELSLGIDYLAEEARITLPERKLSLDATLATIPDDWFTEVAEGSLRLPGRGACVRVPHGSLRVPDGPLTVEGWINADRYQGRRPFITKTENSEYGIFVSNGEAAFSIHLDGRYVEVKSKTPLEPKRWYHLAGVFDGSEVRLYVDGQIVARQAAQGKRSSNKFPFYVGADPNSRGNPVNHLTGWIDEVRVSTVARYSEPFTPAARFAPDEHTALLLHLDRNLGPFAPDHSRQQSHGARLGNAKCQPSSRE